MPRTDGFYIYVVLDGSVRLYTPSGILDYLPGQYSISRIDTPTSGYVLTFSEKRDFLALALELTLHDVIAVLLDLDGNLAERIAKQQIDSNITEASDGNVISSVCRLLSVLDEPVQLAFMGNHIKREIIFHILCGSCGSQFLQSVINIQQAGEIYEINRWIKENFRNPFTVTFCRIGQGMALTLQPGSGQGKRQSVPSPASWLVFCPFSLTGDVCRATAGKPLPACMLPRRTFLL